MVPPITGTSTMHDLGDGTAGSNALISGIHPPSKVAVCLPYGPHTLIDHIGLAGARVADS
jgi:hypothetical protein